jgi:hypothetical protein
MTAAMKRVLGTPKLKQGAVDEIQRLAREKAEMKKKASKLKRDRSNQLLLESSSKTLITLHARGWSEDTKSVIDYKGWSVDVESKTTLKALVFQWALSVLKIPYKSIPDTAFAADAWGAHGKILDMDLQIRTLRSRLKVQNGRLLITLTWPEVMDEPEPEIKVAIPRVSHVGAIKPPKEKAGKKDKPEKAAKAEEPDVPVEKEQVLCPKCNVALEPEANFCRLCGEKRPDEQARKEQVEKGKEGEDKPTAKGKRKAAPAGAKKKKQKSSSSSSSSSSDSDDVKPTLNTAIPRTLTADEMFAKAMGDLGDDF